MRYKAGDIIEIQPSSFIIEDLGNSFRGSWKYESRVKYYLSKIEPLFKKHYRIFTISGYSEGDYFMKELGNFYTFPEKFIKGLYIGGPINNRFEILDL